MGDLTLGFLTLVTLGFLTLGFPSQATCLHQRLSFIKPANVSEAIPLVHRSSAPASLCLTR